MPSINFSSGTTVPATWLNDVDDAVFNVVPLLAPKVMPVFTAPDLGNAIAATINKVAITAPASGATLTIPDGATAVVSGTNTGDQLTFKTITVSGQSDIVADSLTDTLTIAAGAGVALTTNASTDTLTISANVVGLTRNVRSANTMILATDLNKLFYITGTFTQTFDTPANLGSTWSCRIQIDSTSVVTIPSADGVTNWNMYPGEVRDFYSDGSNLYSIVVKSFNINYTTPGTATFVAPPGYAEFGGVVISGGASGQRTNNLGVASRGGAGGGAFPVTIPATLMGVSQTITVGAGGASVSGVAAPNVGGDSSIGTLLVVTGASSSSGGAAAGFVAPLGNQTGTGFESPQGAVAARNAVWGGATASSDGSSVSGSGRNSIYGGAAGGDVDTAGNVRTAGTSSFAGSGGAAGTTTSGIAGSAPGGGGGATQTGTQSGAGGRGEVRIWGIL